MPNETIIDKVLHIDAELIASTSLEAEVNSGSANIEASFGEGAGQRLPYYEGLYRVIPKAYEGTVLETKNKSMDRNVNVSVIPTEEVSNLHGTTFAIAREGVVVYGL